MHSRLKSLLEIGAFLIGAALVASVLVGGAVGGGWARPPLDLTLDAQRSTVLDLQPSVKLRVQGFVRPSPAGRGVAILLSARNASGKPVAVRVRTAGTSHEFDSILRVRVRAHQRTLYSGPLAGLRRGVALGTLPIRRKIGVRVEAWLPLGATGYEARAALIPLTFDARRVPR